MKNIAIIFIIVIFISILNNCTPTSDIIPNSGIIIEQTKIVTIELTQLVTREILIINTITQPSPSQNENVFYDCNWRIATYSWIDTNKNEISDTGEKPLLGVNYYILEYPIYHRYGRGPSAISNINGIAIIDVFQPACPYVNAVLLAIPPQGYISTTNDRIYFSSDDDLSSIKYYFGFIEKE